MIRSEDMDLVGDVVQNLASFLAVEVTELSLFLGASQPRLCPALKVDKMVFLLATLLFLISSNFYK